MSAGWEFWELRQTVGDLEPRCLGTNEDMGCGLDRWRVDQSAQGDMDKSVLADDGEQQGAAGSAVDVVRVGGVAVDQNCVGALNDPQMIPCDPGKRFES